MNFVKLSVKFWGDETLSSSIGAKGLFACLLSYCGDQQNDGRMTRRGFSMVTLGEDQVQCEAWLSQLESDKLVSVGDDGSIRIVGYAKWQTTKKQIKQKRDDAAERARKSRASRKKATGDKDNQSRPSHETVTRDVVEESQDHHASVTELEVEVETEVEIEPPPPPQLTQDGCSKAGAEDANSDALRVIQAAGFVATEALSQTVTSMLAGLPDDAADWLVDGFAELPLPEHVGSLPSLLASRLKNYSPRAEVVRSTSSDESPVLAALEFDPEEAARIAGLNTGEPQE